MTLSRIPPDALDPTSVPVFEVRHLAITHPSAEPLLRELADEYGTRYGPLAGEEMRRFPDHEFDPPDGAFLLVFEDGEAVAGGAFRRYDADTAELKRIWTHSAHRRRGLARRVLEELEHTARERGYTKVTLTTGPRQPEAKALYLATGYTALPDVEETGPHGTKFHLLAFEKSLTGSA